MFRQLNDLIFRALFLRLFAPIALFVVTMLQLKFFHGPWSRATSPRRAAEDPPTESAVATTSETGRANAGGWLITDWDT